MEPKLLLSKCITLLYRESLISDKNENSADLVRTAIETIAIAESNIGMNTDRDVIRALKETTIEMCNYPYDHEYDPYSLIETLRINCGYDEKLFDSLEQTIKQEIVDGQLKRSVVNIRKSIANYFKAKEIENILQKAAYEFKFKRETIADVNTYVANVISQLEPLQLSNTSKDPAVVTDLDMSDATATTELFKDIKSSSKKEGLLVTGWQAFNEMWQGGFRRGEFICVAGLQHKYKTGFSLSVFEQIARYNTPKLINPNRKPLLLRISFEDDLKSNMQFIYQKLKYQETGEPVHMDQLSISEAEMAQYVREKLGVNGFHIKMRRVDPSQWTYRHICNYLVELESEGYEIVFLMLDYLAMVPTTGCTMGPTGTDMRDLFRRVRNFTSARSITCFTPHQLSTEAKQMIRAGVPEENLVKEISEKGYYSGSRQLDQELDCEAVLHTFKKNKETWLAVQRGKHRIPTILPDEKKYFLLKFPSNGMPIPDDFGMADSSFRRLPRPGEIGGSASTNMDDLFKI